MVIILNMGRSYAENEIAQQLEAGASGQVRSQAGAWERGGSAFPSWSLGTRWNKELGNEKEARD
jgi:hypothetical protein